MKNVGPILQAGDKTTDIVKAIRQLNTDVVITDRGSYVRVEVPEKCLLTRESLEKIRGESVDLRAELEKLMCSFQGQLQLNTERASWEAPCTL